MKKKRLISRRQRALRNIGIAVIVILLTRYVNLYSLTPMQAIEQAKERSGIFAPTEVVTYCEVPEMHRFHRLYMIENENTVALTNTVLQFIGWTTGSAFAVDCTEDRPVHCGAMALDRSRDNDGKHLAFYYGRVDSSLVERVEIVEIVLEKTPIDPDDRFKYITDTIDIPRSEWIERDGYYLFFHETTEEDNPESQFYYRCYDDAGNIIYQEYIFNYGYSQWV